MESTASYDGLNSNPHCLVQLLSKYVKVQLIKNEFVCGFVHAIDPIQHSIILLELRNEKYHEVLIPGHAILDVVEECPIPNSQPPFRKTLSVYKNVCQDKKQRLLSWFKQNLLEVTESGDNIVFESVVILPPYNISDVCTTNPIVAMHVKKIMKTMPGYGE